MFVLTYQNRSEESEHKNITCLSQVNFKTIFSDIINFQHACDIFAKNTSIM